MPASYEDKIKQQGQAHLEDGERVLAAFIAQPRGATIAKVGGLAPGTVGGRRMTQQRRAAEEGGLKLTTPMALTLTDRRLVVFAVSQPIGMGKGGDVKDLISAAPLARSAATSAGACASEPNVVGTAAARQARNRSGWGYISATGFLRPAVLTSTHTPALENRAASCA